MNSVHGNLVDLVSCAIRGIKAENIQIEDINWTELLEVADSHNVKALVYSALSDKVKLNAMDQQLLQQCKRDTILTAVSQMKHINQVVRVLNKFNNSDIPVITLKGLVIRELYPRPELRTMCDADILVKEEDLYRIKEILESMGYSETDKSPVHVSYLNKQCHHIEVHWTIEDTRFFKNSYKLEQKMWQDAESFTIGGCEVLSFSPEDLAIHLCLHMAVHILTSGFGIRQLCDLVLLIEKRGKSIDWQSFYNKGSKWGISEFIVTIFMSCKLLFNINVPGEIEKHSKNIDSKLINLLSDDILSGGVYGKKDLTHMIANEFAHGSERNEEGSLAGIMRRFGRLLFPPISKMSRKYIYAKKYKVLLPIAWIHHFISGITHDSYELGEKVSFLKDSFFVSYKRHKLLKRLGL